VLSLVDAAWNAGTAAFTYLNHLAHEAAAIGAEVVARTAAAIVHVGQVIASALERFLSYLLQLVTDLLEPVTHLVSSAMTSYSRAVETAIGHAQNDTLANGTLAPGDAGAVWTSLSGSVFLLSLGIAAVAVIALTVLSSIDIGPSFLVDVLVELLIGTLTGLATLALMNSVGSEFSTFTSSSVYALESYFNTTFGPQVSRGPELEPALGGGGADSASWTSVALIASTLLEFKVSFPLSLLEIEQANGLGGAFVSGAISLALDIVGIILFVAHLVEPIPLALLILGVAFGAFSLVKTLYLLTARSTLPSLRPILGLNAILQSGNLAGALYGLTEAL
jgi:hypothetical protein